MEGNRIEDLETPITLDSTSLYRGYLLVVAWIEIHQEDLLADWDLAVHGKKPFPIKGLDQ